MVLGQRRAGRSMSALAAGVMMCRLVARCRWNRNGSGVLQSLSWASNLLTSPIGRPSRVWRRMI
ncbi:hypothetical protein [Micromonospora sp. ATCC 39149]|uniref:Uncharacterized protein n=1 Tax=Micromonospora carbonacea TaxID=47853 RepID=A0A7D6CF51_9ACTN|nr:hypothetical protein [Micromonospora sp. ATCC 39149]QLJ99148.1 hypothetical protein HZU44_02930 [Micromonospora carbonacea]